MLSLADKEELAEMGIDLSDAELLAKQNEESEDAHMENDSTAYQAQQTESADVSLTDAAPVTGASEETDAAERQLIQEQQQQSYQRHPGVSTAPQAPPIPGPTFAAAPGKYISGFMRNSRFPRFPAGPVADLVLGQDDALRNMNMAWFYAGYYQCQYESQQRTARQSG